MTRPILPAGARQMFLGWPSILIIACPVCRLSTRGSMPTYFCWPALFSQPWSGVSTSLPTITNPSPAYLVAFACFSLPRHRQKKKGERKEERKKKKTLLTFVVCVTPGYSFCFGILSDYYSRTEPFKESSAIANIGTCCSGIMYLGSFPALVLNRMFPRWARFSPLLGLFILCAALCMSAWATNVPVLIITQGVFYGVGGAIAYTPCTMYIDVCPPPPPKLPHPPVQSIQNTWPWALGLSSNTHQEWFVKRKGLAYGIMWSGTSLAGVVLPLVLERLLESYGYQFTVIIWAVVLFSITAPLAWYIKPRVPALPVCSIRGFDLRFSLSRRFVLYQLSNTIEAVGFYVPGIYVPIFAGDILGASEFASSLCILILNTSAVFGCIGIGWLIDRFHVTTCVMVSTIGATLGTFLLWGCAADLPMLYVYCVSYGLSAGSFSTTWTGVMREVSGKDKLSAPSTSSSDADSPLPLPLSRSASDELYPERVDPVMVFVLLAAGRGVGNVIAGPMSQAMYRAMSWKGEATLAYGSGFGGLIVLTGVTALGSGICFLGRRAGWC